MVHTSRKQLDEGFTLVELVIALLVLAIVLAAVAPTFYGTMRASSSTDQRSVANGLALAASEQIRSLPYYQIGYTSTPAFCNQSGSSPVVLTYSTPMSSLATQATVRHTTFQIQSCLYWVAASDGSLQAYKQSVVTILWGNTGQYHYTQTSALYPGGESGYTKPANNFTPVTTVPSSGAPPAPPVANSATPYTTSSTDTTTPQTTINVNWNVDNYTNPVQYNVEWWTGSAARPAQPSLATPKPISGSPDSTNPTTQLDFQVGALKPGTLYYFDVVAVSGGLTSQPSNVVSASTTGSSTPGTCTVYSINVSPAQPLVSGNGTPSNFTSLSVTVQATSVCSGLSVEYGVDDSTGTPQAPLTVVSLSYNGSVFSGSASQSTWSRTTYGFVVYQNGTPYSPLTQQNITICKQNGSC